MTKQNKILPNILQNKTKFSARNFKTKLIQQQFGRVENKVVKEFENSTQ